MRLDSCSITSKKAEWENKGYKMPAFDIDSMRKKTAEEPVWVHFGAGNIFRALHARMAQTLLDAGLSDTGIIVCEGFDTEIIDKINRPFDECSILVTLKADGNIEKTVIAAVAGSEKLNEEEGFERMKYVFAKPSLQLATFTITEKGYALKGGDGEFIPAVKTDLENGPDAPQSYIGRVAALVLRRFEKGAAPLALVSTDNCSKNGEKLFDAVYTFAKEWESRDLAKPGFSAYVQDPAKVSFPWTVIDKITPRPDRTVEERIKADGVENADIVVTAKKTYTAPFVNTEECEYLVVEDAFPNGRPPLEKAGVLFASRETVNRFERMKVCTCLNPLHTALAVFGCILGYKRIYDEMQDEDLKALVKKIGYTEGLPVVTDPGIYKPESFLNDVVNLRLVNPFMPDTPQRIATDTSQKLAIRFGETIKCVMAEKGTATELEAIPLVFAGWLRYLSGIDDEGIAFEPSPDPRLNEMRELAGKIRGENGDRVFDSILRDRSIWGVDLFEAGLAKKVKMYYCKMSEGNGAVRKTIHDPEG